MKGAEEEGTVPWLCPGDGTGLEHDVAEWGDWAQTRFSQVKGLGWNMTWLSEVTWLKPDLAKWRDWAETGLDQVNGLSRAGQPGAPSLAGWPGWLAGKANPRSGWLARPFREGARIRKSSYGGHLAWNHWFSYRFDRFLIGFRKGARIRKSSYGGHLAWNHWFSYRFDRFLIGFREDVRIKKSRLGGHQASNHRFSYRF